MPQLDKLSADPPAGFKPAAEAVSVRGEAYRLGEVLGFAEAVAKALSANREFGVRLAPREGDDAGLKVVGYVKGKLLSGESVYEIGFLDSSVAPSEQAQGQVLFGKLLAIDFGSEADPAGPVNVLLDLYVGPD